MPSFYFYSSSFSKLAVKLVSSYSQVKSSLPMQTLSLCVYMFIKEQKNWASYKPTTTTIAIAIATANGNHTHRLLVALYNTYICYINLKYMNKNIVAPDFRFYISFLKCAPVNILIARLLQLFSLGSVRFSLHKSDLAESRVEKTRAAKLLLCGIFCSTIFLYLSISLSFDCFLLLLFSFLFHSLISLSLFGRRRAWKNRRRSSGENLPLVPHQANTLPTSAHCLAAYRASHFSIFKLSLSLSRPSLKRSTHNI